MRHIISILLQNEAGALARVSGMFSARGFNIESLTVAPTHDDTVSRITLVTSGPDEVINQINQQTRKLIDVVDIADITEGDHYEREVMFIKLVQASSAVEDIASRYGAIRLEHDGDWIYELTGTGLQIDDFIAEISKASEITEVVRSGVTAISSGPRRMGFETHTP